MALENVIKEVQHSNGGESHAGKTGNDAEGQVEQKKNEDEKCGRQTGLKVYFVFKVSETNHADNISYYAND